MMESSSKTVTLPEDDPEAFSHVLRWVYRGDIEKPSDERDPGLAQRLFQTYSLADKLCIEVLCNALVDVIVDWHEHVYSYPTLLSDLPNSALKDFLVAQLAWDLQEPGIWEGAESPDEPTSADELKEFFLSGAVEVYDVMKTKGRLIIDQEQGKSLVDPCKESKCKYHKHLDTRKCEEEPREMDKGRSLE